MNPELIPEPFPPLPVLYPVQEVYPTIQGEGIWAGCPAVFVRLMGRGVAEPPEGPCGLVPTFALMSAEQVVRRVQLHAPVAHVVLTGGEPAEHDLAPLAEALYQADLMAQLETRGTMPLGLAANSLWWVTLKVGMAGGGEVLAEAAALADEIKWPVGEPDDLDRLHAFLKLHQPADEITIWLHPQSAEATALCVEACLRHGWRLSGATTTCHQ